MIPALLLREACAGVYAALALLILVRTRRTLPLLLAVCCVLTAAWAGIAAWNNGIAGVQDGTDLVRGLGWYGFLFFLYHQARTGPTLHEAGFAAAGVFVGLAGAALFLAPGLFAALGHAGPSLVVGLRLVLAIVELLLIENLYFNLPDHARWHVALPSVLLGALACFDIALCADMVLYGASSSALIQARTVAMLVIAPLLVVAASRGQRWKGRVRLSRVAVFHSATLMLSGGVLLLLVAVGEVFRVLENSWMWLVQVSLGFATVLAVGLLLTSASARSRFQRVFVEHFFAERYDYRRQWLACIRTLSGDEGGIVGALPTRVVRAIGAVVDSPSGALFLREGVAGPFSWAGSWNMPPIESVPAGHPVVVAMRGGTWIARLDGDRDAPLRAAPLGGLGPLWLAVPLLHRGRMVGLVFMAPPRAPFQLEQEVYDLLRIVAQEVATYLAEQQATQKLLQTRDLHDYSKRFAFVAHDIKNVSSQLALLVANAQHHMANPEFQQDVIQTVQSSVRKISALLARLEQPEVDRVPAALVPVARLDSLVATYCRVRGASVTLEHDGSTAAVAIGADAFEAAVTHLLNNALEASSGRPVIMRVRHEARQVVVEIVDRGPGMTAEFVSEHLFRPFTTSKEGGSGIGAFQSRELLREAGGDLQVFSQPGQGTTMRLLLPRTDVPAGIASTMPAATMPAPAPDPAVPASATALGVA